MPIPPILSLPTNFSCDGLDAYVSYKVSTNTTRSGFQSNSFYVRRRYQDFLWLHTRLQELMPHVVVPPLPEKQVMKRLARFDPDFLEKRRLGLQKFLDRVATHSILSSNTEFQTFLEAATWEMTSAKKRGGGLFASLGDSFKNLAAKMILKNPDERFVAIATYFTDLSARLTALDKINTSISKLKTDYATDVAEFGSVFTLISNLETELCNPCVAVAGKMESLSTLLKDLALQEEENYVMALQEYLQYAESVRLLLKRRDALQLHCELIAEELEKKRTEKDSVERSDQKRSFGTMMGKDPNAVKQEKVNKLEQQISELQEAVEKANDENLSANESILADIDRWHITKKEDLKAIFLAMCDVHIKSYQETISAWESLLPQLEAIPN
ncbi:sorting nexin 7 [Capsaspora owczarzaki ATCC 30864]|uniref:Sorting nexin 7 n=1 Tax=Capsaspora owczarzaki (strain ATCC 30864) TaxID=595528 RepID=A0A0D2VKB5_CAPO3|nr:sorting nexin 7 [Capsaspora owczarzaki ATCC 30864]